MIKSSFQQQIAEDHRRAVQMWNAIQDKLNGRYLHSRRRTMACGFLSIALTHSEAILYLTQTDRLVGSALALMRPLVEAAFRGVFVAYKSTEDQMGRILDGNQSVFPPFKEMVESLDSLFGTNEDQLFGRHGGLAWKTLCGYAHGGMEQLGYQVTESMVIQADYEPEMIQKALNSAAYITTLAAMLFLQQTERKADSLVLSEKYRALYPHS